MRCAPNASNVYFLPMFICTLAYVKKPLDTTRERKKKTTTTTQHYTNNKTQHFLTLFFCHGRSIFIDRIIRKTHELQKKKKKKHAQNPGDFETTVGKSEKKKQQQQTD